MGEFEKQVALAEMKKHGIFRAKLRGQEAGKHFLSDGYKFENPFDQEKEPEFYQAWNEGFDEGVK